MSNTDNTDIMTYLDRGTKTLDFSDLRLGELPDVSDFSELTSLTAINCSINKMPEISKLPEQLVILTLNNNNISNINLSGYDKKLNSLFVMNVKENPVKDINVDILENLYVNGELIRFIMDGDVELNDPQKTIELKRIIDEYGGDDGMFTNI